MFIEQSDKKKIYIYKFASLLIRKFFTSVNFVQFNCLKKYCEIYLGFSIHLLLKAVRSI